jgi:signal transduction histidine kinase
VESLLQANRSLLANASHELRSPLTRLKMALAMLDDMAPEKREALKGEIQRNIRELDTLVEEVLLASRLDARRRGVGTDDRLHDPVDVIALAAEEAARVDAVLDLPSEGEAPLLSTLTGDERLLRRALRNLLENARRYGGADPPHVELRRVGDMLELRVSDRGPGVPAMERERIFEPFYRLSGHAEQAGGVGLGLSLVRQIARHHGGEVCCEPRDGGGSCFVLSLPQA